MTSSGGAIGHLSIGRLEHLDVLEQNRSVDFHRYLLLRDGTTPARNSVDGFDGFSPLPVEIKHMILGQCNYQTWFSLLHSNADLRSMAQQRFWTDESVWYLVEAASISATVEAYNSRSDIVCRDFARQIQEIQIDGLDWEMYHRRFGFPTSRRRMVDGQEIENVGLTASKFWQCIMNLYPGLRKIVVNDSDTAHQVARENFDDEFSAFATAAPSDVEVLFLRCGTIHTRRGFSHECPKYRHTYRLDSVNRWTLLHTQWRRHLVVPPIRSLHGIIRNALCQYGNEHQCFADLVVLAILRREVYEQYFFGGADPKPFVCPEPNCKELFEKAGDYESHLRSVIGNHTGRSSEFPIKDADFPSPLPDHIEQPIAA